MANNIRLPEGAECCGCGSCIAACPVDAIRMEERELGCLYPVVDPQRCIRCGKCIKVCPNLADMRGKTEIVAVYAAAAKRKEVLRSSSSGGVFATLAEAVIRDGGIAYGCALEQEKTWLMPRHVPAETISQLQRLQGSKYVQSNMVNAFFHIAILLRQGKTVLFSGTPCQVAALRKHLQGENTENLYCIDLVCHGVPSAALFRDYQKTLKKGKTITQFSFRDKTCGWGLEGKYSLARRKGIERVKHLSPGLSSYYSFFLEGETYRESCYYCRYAGPERLGDVTVCDYWGIEREQPQLLSAGMFSMIEGVSGILVNTAKGKRLLERFGQGLHMEPSSLEKVSKWNGQLNSPSCHTQLRAQLIREYGEKGYPAVNRMFRQRLGIRYPVRKVKAFMRYIKD